MLVEATVVDCLIGSSKRFAGAMRLLHIRSTNEMTHAHMSSRGLDSCCGEFISVAAAITTASSTA